MRFGSVSAILCAALLPHLVAGIQLAPLCEDPVEALQWFNYGIPVPSQCVSQLSAQATEFCRGYLGLAPVTSYLKHSDTERTGSRDGRVNNNDPDYRDSSSLTYGPRHATVPTTVPINGGTVTETETETTAAVTTNYLRRKKKRDPAVPAALLGDCGRCIDLATSRLELTEPNLLEFAL
ncbi:hypothetical protein GE09DRAFT_1226497 [Coniochaeta sp. 2T2.1]|nr:hypothetical protein GE09DRAFT_1226497 [Coniochaeta sp. 2T2.1]